MLVLGSIKYKKSVLICKKELVNSGFLNVKIPQTKPRSSGEVLGCTSPVFEFSKNEEKPIVIFICDGRFHMESAMIANPELEFYQYNPFTKVLSLEKYDINLMKKIRQNMISRCQSAKTVGIIFGILGRQGSPDILKNITDMLLKKNITFYIIMLSEITEQKLNNYKECDCFIQIACPRISIDWGSYFSQAVITPYEAFVSFGGIEWKDHYPMDYYSYEGGEWSNYFNKKPKNYKK
jgi:2-(3-amino-3-carboxypropyl)histidine synthase